MMQRGDHGQAEKHHHLDQAVDQVADQLGKTDHPHLVFAPALLPALRALLSPANSILSRSCSFEQLRKTGSN